MYVPSTFSSERNQTMHKFRSFLRLPFLPIDDEVELLQRHEILREKNKCLIFDTTARHPVLTYCEDEAQAVETRTSAGEAPTSAR
jgi:hypothetical protein